MKTNNILAATAIWLSCLTLTVFLPFLSRGQKNVTINLAPIDGVNITPDNIFNYQMQSSSSGNVEVKGTIRYRNSDMRLSYSFSYMLSQGANTVNVDVTHPRWEFSSSALRELFFNYKVLPSGTFEYCVTVTPVNAAKENNGGVFSECLYRRSDDFFSINLIEPINKAKLKEYNPMLTWVANYSFSNELTYRLRVAEIKKGQNPVNAVMRNQAVYDEKNLTVNSLVYPVFAKPLVANQPYAWTVDAYYKGILLGGAETWQFIIPNDTLKSTIGNRSYIDIKRENGSAQLYILGELKLKYVLDKVRTDILTLQLLNEKKEPVTIKPGELKAVYGDNRYVLNLKDDCRLKHQKDYMLVVTSRTGESYTLSFRYLNPDFVQ